MLNPRMATVDSRPILNTTLVFPAVANLGASVVLKVTEVVPCDTGEVCRWAAPHTR